MHAQLLQLQGGRDGRRAWIRVAGEIDVATAPQLATCWSEHTARQVEVMELDMSAVGFIDSTGVRLLLTLAAEAQREGWVLTIVPSDAVRRIVCLLGLEQRLLGDALSSAGRFVARAA